MLQDFQHLFLIQAILSAMWVVIISITLSLLMLDQLMFMFKDLRSVIMEFSILLSEIQLNGPEILSSAKLKKDQAPMGYPPSSTEYYLTIKQFLRQVIWH
jgi:hypothetical protein